MANEKPFANMCPTCGGSADHCSHCGGYSFPRDNAHGVPEHFVNSDGRLNYYELAPPLGSLNTMAPMRLCPECYEYMLGVVWDWLYSGPGLTRSTFPGYFIQPKRP